MKKIILFFAAIVLIHTFSSAQTIIPAGNVSGTWTFAGSPYLIQGAIMIPNNSTLSIEPGVTVNFQGPYKLYVQGRFLAIGAVADTISFTAADTTIGWLGIQFDNTPTANDTSKFFYCKLQYSKAAGGNGAFYFVNFSKIIVSNCNISNCRSDASPSGGAIHCAGSNPIIMHNIISNNTTSFGGGGICCENSNPSILYNTISNNSAPGGGGGAISCWGIYNSSNANISNNIITNNTASFGGGIYCSNNSPTISSNFISNNSASNGGGIYCSNNGIPAITNNTISNNSASNGGGGIYCDYTYSSPTITSNTISNNSAAKGGALFCSLYSSLILHNTILWGNTASTSGQQLYLDDENSDPDFYYCNIQGGTASFGLNSGIFYTGIFQNNIDTIPLFVAPSAGSGTGYNGATGDWSLQAASPCINAGTPDTTGLNLPSTDIDGNPRIRGGRIDIGAYEYPLPNSVNEAMITSPMGIYPNPATNYLTIEIQEKSEIEIINVKGQIIKTMYSNSTVTTVDLTDIASGIYIVRVKTYKEIAIKKFIKE